MFNAAGREFLRRVAFGACMKTRVTALLASALVVGAITAPAADARFCRTVADSTSKALSPALETVNVQNDLAIFGTACSSEG